MNADQMREPFGVGLRRIQLVVTLLVLSGQEAVDEISSLLHPELRVLAAPGVAPASGYQSREEFLAYFAEARAHGMLIQPDAHDIKVSPSGAVVVAGNLRISGPAGVDQTPAWFVYTFRDGLIATLGNYLDREMAEEAAGLPAHQVTA